MIHLPHKQNSNAPLKLTNPGALRQISSVIQARDGNLYNSTYYPNIDIKNLLKAFSIHKTELAADDQAKCNYCESKIEHAATLQVEHYRPKAKVDSGENDHTELPGYYWLGLEWTNLLLACPKCNGKDAKGNKFPIRGNRATVHNPITNIDNEYTLVRDNCYIHSAILLQEDPLLLNPEIDHPEEYLTFNTAGKILSYGNDRIRGEVSKEIYKLNRDELIICRQKVWNDFRNRIDIDIAGHMANLLDENALRFNFGITINGLLKRKQPTEEYTLWGRFINENISDFISDLENYYKNIFISEYNRLNIVP